jgi:hypothetical protein
MEANSMINNKPVVRMFLCAMLWIPLSGCTATVGQQFREIMAEIDAKCRKDKMGPYLDPNDPDYIRKRPVTDCDILKIKPTDPLATEEGRFAYSIKLPPPHDKPKVQYQPGMSAENYFKVLCEKEDGDYVFRTVDGVEGIKIMRPIPTVTSVPLWEEAFGPSPGYFVGVINGIYRYVDAVELIAGSEKVTQLVRYAIDPALSTKEPPWGLGSYPTEKSETRYGFTFRNSVLENRELGILGKELIVLDLETNEVLAFRRIFARLNFMVRYSAQLMQGTPCRPLSTENSDNRFIEKILKPAAQVEGNAK